MNEKPIKRLFRSQNNKMILGVCGGIGNYFAVDPTIIRLIAVFLCILTAVFPMLILYLISALIIPMQNEYEKVSTSYIKLYRSQKNRRIAGICGGIGELTKIDPVVLRLFLLFLCVVTAIFPLLIAYLIGWIIIPEYSKI